MEIVWSESALETFFRVVDYLSDNWSINKINEFDFKVDRLIDNILINNELCPKSKLYGYRKCAIDKNNSLVYSIVNNTILIVTFIDNRSQNIF